MLGLRLWAGWSPVVCLGFSPQWLLLLWSMGSGVGELIVVAPDSVAPWHTGSSQTRDRSSVRCIGRQIINHWTIREALVLSLKYVHQWPHLYLLA